MRQYFLRWSYFFASFWNFLVTAQELNLKNLNPWSLNLACQSPSKSLVFQQLLQPYNFYSCKSEEFLNILSTCESELNFDQITEVNSAYIYFSNILNQLSQNEQMAGRKILPAYLADCQTYDPQDFLILVRLSKNFNPNLNGSFLYFTKWFCSLDEENLKQEISAILPINQTETEATDENSDEVPEPADDSEQNSKPKDDMILTETFSFTVPSQAIPPGLSCNQTGESPIEETPGSLQSLHNALKSAFCSDIPFFQAAKYCSLSAVTCGSLQFELTTEFNLNLLDKSQIRNFYNILDTQSYLLQEKTKLILRNFNANCENVEIQIRENSVDYINLKELETGKILGNCTQQPDLCGDGTCRHVGKNNFACSCRKDPDYEVINSEYKVKRADLSDVIFIGN